MAYEEMEKEMAERVKSAAKEKFDEVAEVLTKYSRGGMSPDLLADFASCLFDEIFVFKDSRCLKIFIKEPRRKREGREDGYVSVGGDNTDIAIGESSYDSSAAAEDAIRLLEKKMKLVSKTKSWSGNEWDERCDYRRAYYLYHFKRSWRKT